MAQWIKDPALSLLWLRFSPWPGNFCMSWAQPKKNILSNRFLYQLCHPPPISRGRSVLSLCQQLLYSVLFHFSHAGGCLLVRLWL